MNLKNLCSFSQNIYKNRLLTEIILENEKEFDILFIQELPWYFIQNIPNSSNKEGNKIVGTSNHPIWIIFSRQLFNDNEHPKVITYINARLIQLCFVLRRDILNYRDISWVFFFNNGSILFMVNVYSDEHQLALKYFKNTKVDICNVLVMTGDFDIRDRD